MTTSRYVGKFATLSTFFSEYFAPWTWAPYSVQLQHLLTAVALLQITIRPMQNEEQEVTVLQQKTSLSIGKRDTQGCQKTRLFSSLLQLHIPCTTTSQQTPPEPCRQHPLRQAWLSPGANPSSALDKARGFKNQDTILLSTAVLLGSMDTSEACAEPHKSHAFWRLPLISVSDV